MNDDEEKALVRTAMEAMKKTHEAFEALIADAVALEKEAARKRALAANMQSQLIGFREKPSLTKVNTSGKVNTTMVSVHRLAISKGRSSADPFFGVIRAKGFTLRSLAERLGCPPSLLSMYRASKKIDGRPCPQARAEKIFKLTGWPADDEHWPNGLVS